MVFNSFRKQAQLQPSNEFKCISNFIGFLWDYLHIEAKPKPRTSAEGDLPDSSSIWMKRMTSFRCCTFLQVFGHSVEGQQCHGSIQLSLSNEDHISVTAIYRDQVLLGKMTLGYELPCLTSHLRFLKSWTPVDLVSDVPFLSSCANETNNLSPASFLPTPTPSGSQLWKGTKLSSPAKGTSSGAFR